MKIRHLSVAPISSQRNAVVLLIVLIVVAMLALGGYTFATLMNTGARAAKAHGLALQARMSAASGVDYVSGILLDQKINGVLGVGVYEDSTLFHTVLTMPQSTDATDNLCYFSVIAPPGAFDSQNSYRFGLMDESGRIHLNQLVAWLEASSGNTTDPDDSNTDSTTESVNPLLGLPNMTEEIADAILDWIDENEDERPAGAEYEYYSQLDPPYEPRNGPIKSLEELLLVAGVTPRLLYGEDVNRNGVLDPNEDDGELTYPSDNADGMLDRGWMDYLTLDSQESNTDFLGEPRINLNGDDLEALYDQLLEDPDFGEDKARFIIAFRLFGAGGSQSGSGSQTGTGGGQQSGTGEGSQAGTDDNTGEDEESEQPEEIAGLKASGGPKAQIASMLDIFGAEVTAELPGDEDPPRTESIKSPFSEDAIPDELPVLTDRATLKADETLIGLINVNSTPPVEVLLAIPGMTEELAETIAAAQPDPASDPEPYTTWLLAEDIVTNEEYKQFEPYITGRSHVFRVQVVSYYEKGGPMARIEAVIDLTGITPQIKQWRDLTELGRGFDPQLLLNNMSSQ